jgi:hypothetical protein
VASFQWWIWPIVPCGHNLGLHFKLMKVAWREVGRSGNQNAMLNGPTQTHGDKRFAP